MLSQPCKCRQTNTQLQYTNTIREFVHLHHQNMLARMKLKLFDKIIRLETVVARHGKLLSKCFYLSAKRINFCYNVRIANDEVLKFFQGR